MVRLAVPLHPEAQSTRFPSAFRTRAILLWNPPFFTIRLARMLWTYRLLHELGEREGIQIEVRVGSAQRRHGID